jgi:hypothetical protein
MAWADFFILLIIIAILYITGCLRVTVTKRIIVDDDGQPLQVTRRIIRLTKGPIDWHVATFGGRQKLSLNSEAVGKKDLGLDQQKPAASA